MLGKETFGTSTYLERVRVRQCSPHCNLDRTSEQFCPSLRATSGPPALREPPATNAFTGPHPLPPSTPQPLSCRLRRLACPKHSTLGFAISIVTREVSRWPFVWRVLFVEPMWKPRKASLVIHHINKAMAVESGRVIG